MFSFLRNPGRFNSTRGHKGKRAPSRARPTLEALEDRLCMSCVAVTTDGGHTLKITGDNQANVVSITQNDQAGVDKLYVNCDNHLYEFTSSQITKIKVDLKGGGDQFAYGLDYDFIHAKDVKLDLGKGNDTAFLNFYNNGNIHGNLGIRLDAGEGNDDLSASFGSLDSAKVKLDANMGCGKSNPTVNLFGDLMGTSQMDINIKGGEKKDMFFFSAEMDMVNNDNTGIDIAAGASLKVKLDGGQGNDVIDAFYEGELKGQLTTKLTGGDGEDMINHKITLRAGSTGYLDGSVYGQSGNDNKLIFKVVENPGSAAHIKALLDGGSGHDTCVHTANVTTVHCEA